MFKRIGNVVVHTQNKYKASKCDLLEYQELTGKVARCGKCGTVLKAGDYLDHHFPYEVSMNRCVRCYHAEKRDRLSNEDIEEMRKKILESAFDD